MPVADSVFVEMMHCWGLSCISSSSFGVLVIQDFKMLKTAHKLVFACENNMNFKHPNVIDLRYMRFPSLQIPGCLQLLEILEISWNLYGPPGNFCVTCR